MRAVSYAVQGGDFRSDKPAPIGHNGGPPLDLGWNAWNWRRAHAKAWKTPGREIVMLRARRAEQLGLSYRAYTSVLLDRGVRLCGLVVVWSESLRPHEDRIAARLGALTECRIVLCGADLPDSCRLTRTNRETLASCLRDAAAAAGTSPGAFFMVGSDDADRRLAQALGLGLFLDAGEYFGFSC